jgi:hypothetical protein
MRKLMLLLAVFGLVASLWAADPSVGTWKLNIAKSKFAPGQKATPKEGTVVVRELPTQEFELTLARSMTDGSKTSQKMTWPKQGGTLQSQGGALPEGTSVVVTMIAPGEWYTTYLQKGKQVQLIHSVISKDGKAMHLTTKGTDAQGKPTETSVVFDKQ